jgi:hypothetical protein
MLIQGAEPGDLSQPPSGGPATGRAQVGPPRPQPAPDSQSRPTLITAGEDAHPAALNLVTVGTDADGAPGTAAGAAPRDWIAERPSRLAGIVATEPPPRRGLLAGPTLLAVALAVLLVAGLTAGAFVLLSDRPTAKFAIPVPSVATAAAEPSTAGSSAPAVPPPAAPGDVISMSATGDIIMGAAPGGLPPDGAKEFFADVKGALRADLQMGNLEQPLTNDTGVTKCPPPPSPAPGSPAPKSNCFAFRSPPAYAEVLRDAGFKVLNLANNHAYDFGAEGNRQTRTALDGAGLAHTGAPAQITVVEVKGVKVAVLGFSSYAWSQSIVDIEAGAALVRKAKGRAELVVVQMHAGGEGADKTHVRPGTEMFLGENRGDPIKFARAVVDAGADLVVGHGPHVMRGMEFYKGKLIAYSLGNFAGYKALTTTGVVGVGGVLKVTLRKDGSYVTGSLVPTRMVAPGLPRMDAGKEALALVRGLSESDLPATAARIGDDGSIAPR